MQPTIDKQATAIVRVLLWTFLCLPLLAQSADLAREQRIDEQISSMILDGEVMHLKDGSHPFLAIYTKTERKPIRGAALILHGRGANPDWIDVVHPLRTGLSEYGWNTLAIQLPVASEGASASEWVATIPESLHRVEAALAYLKQQGMQNIVIVSHSFATHTIANYLAGKPDKSVRAWVAVGMPPDDRYAETDTVTLLRKIRIPVLDLYGEQDLVNTRFTAEARRAAARAAGNKGYEQREIPGADHFFTDLDGLLVSTVRAWLSKVASGNGTASGPR